MDKDDGQPRRFFYGWVVVGISGLVFADVRGINDALGVFLVAFACADHLSDLQPLHG
jgi:hypothetical protein